LRFVLVRDVFFKGPASIDITPLLVVATKLGDAALTLIGAKARGAVVPPGLLLQILEQAQSDEAWVAYAWIGTEEANTVLKLHPGMLIKVARASLQKTPGTVIPMLLDAAKEDFRPLHSNTDHPLRLINDWIDNAYPGTGDVLHRRKALLSAIDAYLSKNGNPHVTLRALPAVFSLRFEHHSLDPGYGRTVAFNGVITLEEVKEVEKFGRMH
jgi:hypothetical protein